MRVAVCQLNAGGGDVDANVATAVRLLREAADDGAVLAVLPELWPHYGTRAAMHAIASSVPGGITDLIAEVARERGMWIVAGSVIERDGDHIFNTSALLDPEGEAVAVYRKIHLFDVELAGQPPLRESELFSAGDRLVTHETPAGRLGLSICYDLRFPELYRGLVAQGAELLAIPSAFTAATGEAHWEVLVRARAIEDQCVVLAAAQWGPWGPAEDGRRTYGHAMIVDAWGRVLAEAPADGDAVLVAEIDRDELLRVRRSLPALAHRRLGTVC